MTLHFLAWAIIMNRTHGFRNQAHHTLYTEGSPLDPYTKLAFVNYDDDSSMTPHDRQVISRINGKSL